MARVPKKVADRFATTVGVFQRVLADAKVIPTELFHDHLK